MSSNSLSRYGLGLLAGRGAGAGLLGWMGWIHLHLWSAGYMHLHVIGPLFLVNFILAVACALGELAVPVRWLAPASAAACVLVAGTLVSLAVSINAGLSGFRDYLNGPFVWLSIWVEGAALVVVALTGVRAALAARR